MLLFRRDHLKTHRGCAIGYRGIGQGYFLRVATIPAILRRADFFVWRLLDLKGGRGGRDSTIDIISSSGHLVFRVQEKERFLTKPFCVI